MADEEAVVEKKTIEIAAAITVGDLAKALDIPVTKLITELMKNGIMATVNEKLDFDTAQIIVGEMDESIELTKAEDDKLEIKRVKRDLDSTAVARPPVVAVMGHVDHGKTSLLDAIRGAHQVDTEAGGITQHISAYQVTHNDRAITFLDTPGHEAFAALREHGAKLTDVAIIVIAADDGMKPQTEEAIRFAQKAGVKIIVAINKIDKEGANVNLIKQQLSEKNLLAEEWGGDTVIVEVSAVKKTGIDKLMDMILLVADVEELKADAEGAPEGLVIEAHMEVGRGPVITALVEHGHINPGDIVVAGASYGKIRTLQSVDRKDIKSAGPSTPVVITGFKELPQFGDSFVLVKTEKEARALSETHAAGGGNAKRLDMTSSDLISMINKKRDTSEVNVIIRADVQGSLTSVVDSLRGLENEEVQVRVVGSGVGNISENDISMAATSDAIIYGFNVDVPVAVKRLASREKVALKVFRVIYELIDDVKVEMEARLEPELVETEVGRLLIRGVFRTTQKQIICGGEVTKGKAKPNVIVKIYREDELLGEAQVESVQRQQQEAKEIIEGEMCGLQLATTSKILLNEGDRLEFITRETVKRTL
jgi:translation initiation factor IF-2